MNRDHTHRPSLTVSSFLTLQHVTVNVGDKVVGACNNGVCVGNDGAGVRNNGVHVCDITTNIRDVRICGDCKLGLGMVGWR
jgi:hypothetical protein